MRLHDFVDHQAREQPGAEFVVDGHRSWTYRQGAEAIDRLANALIGAGLRPRDRFAIVAKNGFEYVASYFAASKAGAVIVPLNYRLTAGEWARAIHDSGARLVIAGPTFQEALGRVRSELGSVRRWVSVGRPLDRSWADFDAWVGIEPARPPPHCARPEDELYQMYTSGTTGRPKGAVVPQRAITWNVLQYTHAFGAIAGERCLVVAPLYHVASALIAFASVAWGSSLYLQEDFVPAAVLSALGEASIAYTILVPAMIQACLAAAPDAGARRYPRLKHLLYGGSPISPRTLRSAVEAFRCELWQGYGMTETAGVNTVLTARDHREALGGRPELLLSAGRPLLGTDVRITRPEDGQVLPAGAPGEIEIRGPQLMLDYWNMPEARADTFRDGWLRTGDAGVLDDRGYLYVQDRVKDMILSGGENIYPREVEEILVAHPAVADVAVFGVPDDRWGEAVRAAVVLRRGHHASAEALIEHCRERLAGFKRPRAIDLVAELPRSPTGKVLKRELREPYWRGHERRVGGA